ncbi:uncharacterized protein LOC108735604 [Agrilus planipennis]|uniref:Uncharacterized protein LOC108735604 n=1 Tax=Agrilus planipennis TaxID=224129 RepID=A0A1W4WGP7_AGRPL|nr:uncharacterized protein LOC108735604 [Agrilus planipennis]
MDVLTDQKPNSLDSLEIQQSHVTTVDSCFSSTHWGSVKMREKRYDKSETQRKRNSKNRLSNRRSTGPISPDELEAAIALEVANQNE